MNFSRPADSANTSPRLDHAPDSAGSLLGNTQIEWIHSPGSTVPYKSKDRIWSVGVNFHGLYQAVKLGNGSAKAIGEMCPTPEEAKAIAEAHAGEVGA